MKLTPHLYRRMAPSTIDPRVIDRVIEIERQQQSRGLPALYSLRHLAHRSGVPYLFLRQVVERAIDPYDIFSIRKRDGVSLRSIAAPQTYLSAAQRWLLDEVFSKAPLSSSSFAYQSGLSAPKCAAQHLGARWLIKMDLQDFFHQTDERDVYHLTRRLGYGELVAFEISRIVTRSVREPQPWLPAKYEAVPKWRRGDGFPYGAPARLGYLPQGASTSGAISNLLASELDGVLQDLAIASHLTYTRYADDLIFSSVSRFTRPDAGRTVAAISSAISARGYVVNQKKTRIAPPGSRLEILGVLVDGPQLRLAPRIRHKVERHLRGLERFGIEAHREFCGFRDIDGMRNHIGGLIAYCHSVDPAASGRYFHRFNEAFPLPPSNDLGETSS